MIELPGVKKLCGFFLEVVVLILAAVVCIYPTYWIFKWGGTPISFATAFQFNLVVLAVFLLYRMARDGFKKKNKKE